ncbi:MAG: hypothetical protein U0703_19120 [Anaerolineae bacterium]
MVLTPAPEAQQAPEPWQGSVDELRGLVSDRAITGETAAQPGSASSQHARRAAGYLLELDSEEIVTCLPPDVGYLHTGIEKTIESKTYEKAVTLTDRMDYLSPMSNNAVFSMAVEKLTGLDVPARAQAIRVICADDAHPAWPSGLAGHARDGFGRDERLSVLYARA